MQNIIVIESQILSKEYEKRFVVVDKNTGEILDDAQGYGYKTVPKAYATYAYKTRDKSKDKEKAAKQKQIKQWMKEHKDFVKMMDIVAFEIVKGSWGEEEKFDAKFVKKMLAEHNLKPNFTAGDLLKVWKSS